MKKLNVIFIGGLTNGEIVLDYLLTNKYVDISLIITYPNNHRCPRYVDLSNRIKEIEIFQDLNANRHIETIRNLRPDFIFVAGWSGLLSKDLIPIPLKGTIGFHPSKLPRDRGRSVLAWQIEEGYTETVLTMFYYNELPDCGDIIAQERIKIEHNDYINDILNKVDNAAYNLMRAYFPLLRIGAAPRKQQDINEGNFRRLGTDRDSLINWDQNAEVIYNKIRAISMPYPGAFFYHDSQKVMVWGSEIVEIETINNLYGKQSHTPGTIVKKLDKNKAIVKCRDKYLKICTDDFVK